MSATDVYAGALTLLGLWGVYAARKSVKPTRGWSWRRRFAIVVESVFVASCLGCAAALWSGRFQPWMAASIGLSYLLMIPLPCYFELVNRVRWLHVLRNILFIATALFLVAIAAGLIPLSSVGLE